MKTVFSAIVGIFCLTLCLAIAHAAIAANLPQTPVPDSAPFNDPNAHELGGVFKSIQLSLA